jgi:hypothetical protein
MHSRDIIRRALHRSAESGVERVKRASTRFAWHLELTQINGIQLASEGLERHVAITPDSCENCRDAIPHVRIATEAALEENGSRARVQIRNRSAYGEQRISCSRGDGRAAHGITLSMRVTRSPSPPSALRSAIVR